MSLGANLVGARQHGVQLLHERLLLLGAGVGVRLLVERRVDPEVGVAELLVAASVDAAPAATGMVITAMQADATTARVDRDRTGPPGASHGLVVSLALRLLRHADAQAGHRLERIQRVGSGQSTETARRVLNTSAPSGAASTTTTSPSR